ncbi:MAG: chorismate mutase [Coriobacteriia bacterium]|nr:chorismate mutase [Coriobacteriia bacterium]
MTSDNLTRLRDEIDAVDTELAELFDRRMALVARVAAYKAATGEPIFDEARERAILERVGTADGVAHDDSNDFAAYRADFFTTLLDLSRRYQSDN